MERQWLKVKAWKVEEENSKLAHYGSDLVLKRDKELNKIEEEGYLFILSDGIIKETEKAICVIAETGDVLDRISKEWKMWIPKSCLA